MSMPPCKGAGITIVDPGPVRIERRSIYTPLRRLDGTPRLLRVLVERIVLESTRVLYWHAGIRTGQVRLDGEGIEWVRGHGPQARAALLAARKLAGLD